MTVLYIPGGGALVRLSGEELGQRGLTGEGISPRQALELLRAVCPRLPPAALRPAPRLEVFPGPGETLLLLRPRRAPRPRRGGRGEG